MDMNLGGHNGQDCKECWKNETYNWGPCDHHTCEFGEQQNNDFKTFYALL